MVVADVGFLRGRGQSENCRPASRLRNQLARLSAFCAQNLARFVWLHRKCSAVDLLDFAINDASCRRPRRSTARCNKDLERSAVDKSLNETLRCWRFHRELVVIDSDPSRGRPGLEIVGKQINED